MNPNYAFHATPLRFWLVVVLALLSIGGVSIAPALAGMSTSQKSFVKLLQDDFRQTLPQTPAGMEMTDVTPGVGGFAARYTGGKPASEIAVVSKTLDADWANELRTKLENQAKGGKIEALSRADRTLYVAIPADESERSTVMTFLGETGLLQVFTRPDGIADGAEPQAIKRQLLAVFDALDLQQVSRMSRMGLPISGHLAVNGAIDVAADLTLVSPRIVHRSATEGVVWSIHLHTAKKGLQVRLFYLPVDMKVGTYKLRERPPIMGSEHPFAQPAANLFVQAEDLQVDVSGDDSFQVWEEGLVGTLVIKSIDNHKMSGSFEFTAKIDAFVFDDVPSVTIKGQFEDVPVLNGQ